MKTIFENPQIKVEKNSSDEIFVTNKGYENTSDLKVCIRIGAYGKDTLHITAHSFNFYPTSFNGLGGFKVR